MQKHIISVLLIILGINLLFSQAVNRYKVLPFDNPGTKRLLQTEAGNYYYYRSLPERALILNTTGVEKIELRSFSKEAIRKPEIVTVINKEQKTYPLSLKEKKGDYYIYQPIIIDIPENTKDIQIICYDRSTYMRAFSVLPPKQPTATKQPNIVIKAHSGTVSVQHNSSNSD